MFKAKIHSIFIFIMIFTITFTLLFSITGIPCIYNNVNRTFYENEHFIPTDSLLRIHFLDVGQADCILITYGNLTILIDSGNEADSEKVIKYLTEQNVETINLVFATHPHDDHIGGMAKIISNFNVKRIVMLDIDYNTPIYQNLKQLIKSKHIHTTHPKTGDVFKFKDIEIKVLHCRNYILDHLNNSSIVLQMHFFENIFLFSSDIEHPAETEILGKNFSLASDLYKVAHHGFETSTSEEYLVSISPKIAIICSPCNWNNQVNHLLSSKNIDTYITGECGIITITSDGSNMQVKSTE